MIKATIAAIDLGAVQIEGLMLPDGSFAVAVSQAAAMFSAGTNNPTKTMKALLGESFQPVKIATSLNPVKANVISISQLELLIFELTIKGNPVAIAISRACLGLALIQRFNDGFGQKFEIEDRNEWMQVRRDSIDTGKAAMAALQVNWLDRHPGEEKVPGFVFALQRDRVNVLLTGQKAAYWRDRFKVTTDESLRAIWGSAHLQRCKMVEELWPKIADEGDCTVIEAVEAAVKALRYTVWSEPELLGTECETTRQRNIKRAYRARKAQEKACA